MSVSISWKPIKRNYTYVEGTSSFSSALEKAFGALPAILNTDDIKKLEGIQACGYEGARELITAILDNNEIEVEAHY